MAHPRVYMRMTRLIALSALLFTGAALAQTPTPKPPPPREIIFGDADVVGGRTHDPNVETVGSRVLQPGSSLIRVRTDFRRELLQSAVIL